MNDRLGLEEFSKYMFENISKMIINRNYINSNEDFFNLLFYKLYEDYNESTLEVISLMKYVKLLEIFLGSLLTEQPTVILPEDYI